MFPEHLVIVIVIYSVFYVHVSIIIVFMGMSKKILSHTEGNRVLAIYQPQKLMEPVHDKMDHVESQAKSR